MTMTNTTTIETLLNYNNSGSFVPMILTAIQWLTEGDLAPTKREVEVMIEQLDTIKPILPQDVYTAAHAILKAH